MPEVELPEGFDEDAYLRLNPDVRLSGADAATHYVRHGHAEGRRWREEVPHFERDYNEYVRGLCAAYPLDEAMSLAVGGLFEEMGRRHIAVLERTAGLHNGMSVVDLGCGSGRTASQIAQHYPNCSYVGIDVVQELLDYAQSMCPPSFRFIRSAQLYFPLDDASTDLVIGFSVFTHLLQPESYAYLQDAMRILRPGGRIVFTFLEFASPDQWEIFSQTVEHRKAGTLAHINTFIERGSIDVWANHLGFDVEGYFANETGQTLCVLRKPQ